MRQDAMQLFVHELKDMYDAEHRLLKGLEEMSRGVSDPNFRHDIDQHRRETLEHVSRLERVFRIVGQEPERQPCLGVKGLIEEYSSFMEKQSLDPVVMDAFAIEAAVKTERYEITAYESLSKMAGMLGFHEAELLLGQTLEEEERAQRKLEQTGERFTRLIFGQEAIDLREKAMGLSRTMGEQMQQVVTKARRTMEDAEERGRELIGSAREGMARSRRAPSRPRKPAIKSARKPSASRSRTASVRKASPSRSKTTASGARKTTAARRTTASRTASRPRATTARKSSSRARTTRSRSR